MNIQLKEQELQGLTKLDLVECELKINDVKIIGEQGKEISYFFTSPEGNLSFMKRNGAFEGNSVPDNDNIAAFRAFCHVAEQNDVNYTAVGFEPF